MMSKRKYKLFLEPESTIKVPKAKFKGSHLAIFPSTDDGTAGSQAIVDETMAPSEHQSSSEGITEQVLQHMGCNREKDDVSGSDLHTTDIEPQSSTADRLQTAATQLEPCDVTQQLNCGSSSEDSDSEVESEVDYLPEDEPFDFGFDKDMDSVLMSAALGSHCSTPASLHSYCHEDFVDLCILLGCDYCEKITALGPERALPLIRQHRTIEMSGIHLHKDGIMKQDDGGGCGLNHRNIINAPKTPPDPLLPGPPSSSSTSSSPTPPVPAPPSSFQPPPPPSYNLTPNPNPDPTLTLTLLLCHHSYHVSTPKSPPGDTAPRPPLPAAGGGDG